MLLGLKISKMKILYFVFKLCKWPCFSLQKQKYKTKIANFAPQCHSLSNIANIRAVHFPSSLPLTSSPLAIASLTLARFPFLQSCQRGATMMCVQKISCNSNLSSDFKLLSKNTKLPVKRYSTKFHADLIIFLRFFLSLCLWCLSPLTSLCYDPLTLIKTAIPRKRIQR